MATTLSPARSNSSTSAVTGIGPTQKIQHLVPPIGGSLREALVKTDQCVFRVRDGLTTLCRPPSIVANNSLLARCLMGRQSFFNLIARRLSRRIVAVQLDEHGNLIITIGGGSMTAQTSTNRKPTRPAIDPVTASVILGALEQIAVEMGYKLMRMAYSSIIRESEDFGAALVNAQGQQLCESKQSTPLQSGPIPGYVRGMLQQLAVRGETVRPGDVIMHNDPYGGASHGPDVGFCVPVFYDNQLVGFSVTTAHHLDIGSQTPGSTGIVEAVDAYAEGLQFKAIKVIEEGKRNDAVWHLLRDNIRVSDLVVGDMEAQIAACRIGAARFLELIDR